MSAPLHKPPCTPKLGLLDHFAGLDDPRQSVKVLVPLPEVKLLVLSATPDPRLLISGFRPVH